MTLKRLIVLFALTWLTASGPAIAAGNASCDRHGHHFKGGHWGGRPYRGHGPRTVIVERPVLLPAPRIGLPHPPGLPLPSLPRLPLP